MSELVRAAEICRCRLELLEQFAKPLSRRSRLAGGEFDQLTLQPAAQRAPAVLADCVRLVHSEPFAAPHAGDERRDERLTERGHGRRFGRPRLDVGNSELERPVVGPRTQVPPEVRQIGKQPGARSPRNEGGEVSPAGERRRDPEALKILGQLQTA